MLTPRQRADVVRETFEIIASIGFSTWRAEELLYHGVRVTEQDRQDYLREFEKNFFAEFQQITAGASDERLLDARQDWIDKANELGLLEWRAEQGRDMDREGR